MRIIDILQSCIFPIDGMILHTGAKWLQNIKADDIDFPCVFMDRPIQWRATKVGKFAVRQEVYSPMLYFAEKTRPDWEQWQHDEVIERQRANVAQFLETISIHPQVDIITSEPICTDLINFLDLNTSGVSVSFSVRLKIADGTCPNAPLLPSRPLIESVSPSNAYNIGLQIFNIIGSGFVDGLEVYINGDDISVSLVEFATSELVVLSLYVPTDVKLGTRNITIANPDNQTVTLENALNILID